MFFPYLCKKSLSARRQHSDLEILLFLEITFRFSTSLDEVLNVITDDFFMEQEFRLLIPK